MRCTEKGFCAKCDNCRPVASKITIDLTEDQREKYNILVCKIDLLHKKKDYNTWTSQVVTHPSTTQARRCLTTEIGRDPVFSS